MHPFFHDAFDNNYDCTAYSPERRHFLKLGLAAASTLLLPEIVLAGSGRRSQPERILRLYNTHTGESLKTVYWADGKYLPDAMASINRILRDHRQNRSTTMSRRLIDNLYLLSRRLDVKGPIHIISGYRSPVTNAALRCDGCGVAKKSQHMSGRAIDIRIPGKHPAYIRRAVLSLHAGGTGYYPKSNFVHMDVGRIRQWRG